jgi:hypothetical protein
MMYYLLIIIGFLGVAAIVTLLFNREFVAAGLSAAIFCSLHCIAASKGFSLQSLTLFFFCLAAKEAKRQSAHKIC